MSKLHPLFFVISLYCALVCADYTIDDSNYSVLKFSENPSGPVWGPFGSDTGEVLEIRLPNGTMQTCNVVSIPMLKARSNGARSTYAACSASNNCAVQFSFTGSGITIYVLQAGPQGMSASLSIDSGTATTATLGAPPAPQYYIPHVTLFNVQNIPSGTHTAAMTVLDWNGGFSGMMLDYIDVNQAVVTGPTTSSSSSPSPSPSANPTTGSTLAQSASSAPTSTNGQTASQQTSSAGTQTNPGASVAILSVLSSQSSGTALPSSMPSGNGTSSTVSSSTASKKTKLAAIVGGVVGGVVGLLALVGLAFFCFRRRRRQHLQTLNERPSPVLLPQPEARFTNLGTLTTDPFGSSAALSVGQPSGTSRPLRSWTDSEAGSTANLAARDASNPSPITNFSHSRVASSADDSATLSVPLSIGVAATGIPQDHDASAPTPVQLAVRPAPTALPVTYPNEKSGPAPGGSLHQGQTANLDVASSRPNAVLTDEQADFVNSLFNNNVPAPVVARVLERMLANPQGASSTGYNDPELRPLLNSGNVPTSWQPTMSDIGDGETTIGTAPPSYDYVRAQ
ncbi:hypothetical protein OG21DRAFT_1481486 [Imleria badia]|nr:hypothetical protein OG21DRAFT_1481486 [Imleria badia]